MIVTFGTAMCVNTNMNTATTKIEMHLGYQIACDHKTSSIKYEFTNVVHNGIRRHL